jgi:uncharacterized membrane protein YdcZ (DUF606 family)
MYLVFMLIAVAAGLSSALQLGSNQMLQKGLAAPL